MRVIIDGKTYDTLTAICIAEHSNNRSIYDAYYTAEDLYLTKNGEFFLHGRGGGMSLYGKYFGDNYWCSGSEIIPSSEEEAKKWLIEHFDVDDYIEFLREHFHEVSG